MYSFWLAIQVQICGLDQKSKRSTLTEIDSKVDSLIVVLLFQPFSHTEMKALCPFGLKQRFMVKYSISRDYMFVLQ